MLDKMLDECYFEIKMRRMENNFIQKNLHFQKFQNGEKRASCFSPVNNSKHILLIVIIIIIIIVIVTIIIITK